MARDCFGAMCVPKTGFLYRDTRFHGLVLPVQFSTNGSAIVRQIEGSLVLDAGNEFLVIFVSDESRNFRRESVAVPFGRFVMDCVHGLAMKTNNRMIVKSMYKLLYLIEKIVCSIICMRRLRSIPNLRKRNLRLFHREFYSVGIMYDVCAEDRQSLHVSLWRSCYGCSCGIPSCHRSATPIFDGFLRRGPMRPEDDCPVGLG